jgi:HAD superfamily hydrolase (TIGR01509 family)
MLQGVLLDVDGTLIDSNDAHAHAWIDALREFGRDDIPFERVRPLIGMGGDKLLPMLLGVEKDSPEGKRFADRRSAVFAERYLPTIEAFPKARELLKRMRSDRLTLVVATSARQDEMKGLLKVVDADDLIDEKTSSSDAEQSKPDPDIVEAAVERSGHDASALVMLGDTPYDIEAAARAGVRCIALRCGGWGDDDLRGAAAIYDDPADLLARYASSPLGAR